MQDKNTVAELNKNISKALFVFIILVLTLQL